VIALQPGIDVLKYRSDIPQWRIWNVTKNDFPPYSLVSLERGVFEVLARTAFDWQPEVKRHVDDVSIDHQITYEAISGPEVSYPGITGVNDFKFGQYPENYLATFDNTIRSDGNGLATQHWPVLVRYTGERSEIPDTWPRYAVPDLENYGITYNERGPFQILGIDSDSIGVPLVWIAPRHIAYRDAWAIGAVDFATGSGDGIVNDFQELRGGIEAVNSPGGADILTIEDGRIVANYEGMYRCSVTAVASGSPEDHTGTFRLTFADPLISINEIPFLVDGRATGSYGWLPLGTEEAGSPYSDLAPHSHAIAITGGAITPRLWDRTTTTIHYTTDFQISAASRVPWQARLLWNGGDGETLSRVRYSIEYMGPRRFITIDR
jgi:hypothetical protein